MGRLILHIGTHKTGTTTLQKTFAKYRRRLRLRGVRYPDYSIIGLRSHYAHIGAANALTGRHASMTKDQAEKFFTTVREESELYDVSLLSAEPMYRQTIASFSPERAPDEERYWYSRDKYISLLRRLVGPAEIVIVFRRQDEFAESMYQEHVKVTRYNENFATFLKQFWFHFAYVDQVVPWKNHFDNVSILSFDAIKGINLAQKFMTALDVSSGKLLTESTHNIGIPPDGIILKRILNSADIDLKTLKRISSVLVSEEFRSNLVDERRSYFSSQDHREFFFESYAEDRDVLAHFAGISPSEMFSNASSDRVIYGDSMTKERADFLLYVLRGLASGIFIPEVQ